MRVPPAFASERVQQERGRQLGRLFIGLSIAAGKFVVIAVVSFLLGWCTMSGGLKRS